MATALNTIKSWFKTGDKPTQAQFWATWDSFFHKAEKVPAESIDGLQGLLDEKADAEALANFSILLDGKSDKDHNHAISNIEGLNEVLDVIRGDVDTMQPKAEKDQPNGYLGLDGTGKASSGKIIFDTDLKFDNYPSSRNDGTNPTNKYLSVDASGNVKLVPMASYTVPAPFLDEIIPDNFQPNSAAKIKFKGANFTPNMTVNFTGGIVVTGRVYHSDNDFDVYVNNGPNVGSFDVTLNNGTAATWAGIIILTYGVVMVPEEGDMTLQTGVADLTEPGNVKIANDQALGVVRFYNIPLAEDFQLRFKAKRSPISTNTYTDDGDQVSIIENGVERYRVRYAYTPAIIFPTQASTGITTIGQIPVGDYPYNGAVNLDDETEFYYERIGSNIFFKRSGVVICQFADLSNTGSITFEMRVKHFDFAGIKYIKLN